MNVVTVIGARPQFIKSAVVSRAMSKRPEIREVIVHTGQHYDENMSDVFFEELEIPVPDYHLAIGSGLHGYQTGRMLEAIEKVLLEIKPEWVLVYGDTNSTLAGALAAAKLHIPVAHVEAGLRSFNRLMPEELNRVVADNLSQVLFAPTETAVQNLKKEGIRDDQVYLVGDVMYDAALFYGAKADKESGVLKRLELNPRGYVLATVHRAENTDDEARLTAICRGLMMTARELPVVLPLHPRTRNILARAGVLRELEERIRIIEPVGYLDMVMLEKNSRVIATDSGGVQKEAFFYRVPCVTLRDETEWVELVVHGWNRIVPPRSAEQVNKGVLTAAEGSSEVPLLYGDGNAADKILNVLGN
ncbi:MAG: UDP-N-acetylglucosamine 2-epimerase (non-hydrolyzing) [Firmicutes bacterium]|nr:UDP-N-acetylglucosamine 2-epimerase (non-hydrolyzing) [Bacillota bacterium]